MINSLFGDGTRSWVRIVTGTDKDVTEMSDEIHIENIGESPGKPVAKARRTAIPVPYSERKWIGVAPGPFEVEPRRDSSTVWTPIQLKLFDTFEQFNVILDDNMSILHYKILYCCRETSSTSFILELHTMRTPYLILERYWVGKMPEKQDMQCF